MYREYHLTLSPSQAYCRDELYNLLARQAGVHLSRIRGVHLLQRSLDARHKNIKVHVHAGVYIDEPTPDRRRCPFVPGNVSQAPPVIIAGAGPAGLFAALQLIEKGYKPVIIERGSEVKQRKRDVAAISTRHEVKPDSNYCFGEGGAGTFSDGKLYTRSLKKEEFKIITETFYYFGADESVLYDSHPHIGTDRLPGVILNIRRYIRDCGGDIFFNTRVCDFIIENGRIKGVRCAGGEVFYGEAVVLATGHSARDIYELFFRKKILIEQKDFAAGVRVEHPQALINEIRYHGNKNKDLPAASYSLAVQTSRGPVYSFCMCPGGFIIPSATHADEIVVNGMSPFRRNSPYANAAIVTPVNGSHLEEYRRHGSLAGMYFQRDMEQKAFALVRKGQKAPAQRLIDFLTNRESSSLPPVSYFPGVESVPLHQELPSFMVAALQEAFRLFEKKMKGFISREALLVGVETRTSSPVRIPRDPVTLEHVQIKGLYPCGEGSGYAGGIASSAMDGIRCAREIITRE